MQSTAASRSCGLNPLEIGAALGQERKINDPQTDRLNPLEIGAALGPGEWCRNGVLHRRLNPLEIGAALGRLVREAPLLVFDVSQSPRDRGSIRTLDISKRMAAGG